jgi:uncharacterized protein (TIGR03435 family)
MAADAHPSFEVATIKPADPNELKGNFFIGGHRIVIENQSVNSLMVFAYAIHQQQIVDGPAWLDTRKYDIVGQADVEGVANLQQIQEMLQKLLETRFNLKFHREKRDLAIYAITVGKGVQGWQRARTLQTVCPPRAAAAAAVSRLGNLPITRCRTLPLACRRLWIGP